MGAFASAWSSARDRSPTQRVRDIVSEMATALRKSAGGDFRGNKIEAAGVLCEAGHTHSDIVEHIDDAMRAATAHNLSEGTL